MKAYKVEILVVDFDGIGRSEIADVIECARYPNRCINPEVMAIEERDVGEWHDNHPLNLPDSTKAEYERLFKQEHP